MAGFNNLVNDILCKKMLRNKQAFQLPTTKTKVLILENPNCGDKSLIPYFPLIVSTLN